MSNYLAVDEEQNGDVPMNLLSPNGIADMDANDVVTLVVPPTRKRKLTGISMDSTGSGKDNGSFQGDEEDDVQDKPQTSKAEKFKDAIMSGNIDAIDGLINQKIDVNMSDSFGRSPLHNAVLKGIPEIVSKVLDAGADVNIQDDRGDTPVHFAARAGNPEILKMVLSNHKCDVNLKGSGLNSPLHIAAALNKPRLCQMLLEHHANPNSQEENGKSPLARAVESGATQSARYLLDYMTKLGMKLDDILYNQDFDGTTLLHLAVDSGFAEVVQTCLEYGAMIRQPRRSDRTTAFHMACEQGSTSIVELLVQHDPKIAKILLVNAEGVTPLHQAAQSNSFGIAKILIENGADVNALTKENRTPMMYAAKRGGTETVQLLMQRGADTTIRDVDNRTAVFDAVGYPATMAAILEDSKLAPLLMNKDLLGFTAAHYAAKKGDTMSMELFLDHNKASASAVSDQLDTPLHVAAKFGMHEVVRTLLEKQGNKIINAQNSRNRTALHLACSGGHFKAAILLLEKNASIERDQNGRTALHEAAQNGATKVVAMVIEKHTHCLNFTDDDKNTAVHLAVQYGHGDIIDLLLSLHKQEILKNSSNQNVLDLAVNLENPAGAMAIAKHQRWREILESCTHGVNGMMKKLIVKMPQVAEQIFDNCIETEGDKTSEEHKIKFDLNVILRKSKPEVKSSLEILKVIADNRIENCLTHKLTFIALSTKWNSYGWLAFVGSILSVLCYLLPITILHANLEDDDAKYCSDRVTTSDVGQEVYLLSITTCLKNHLDVQIQHWICVVIIALQLLKESFQIYTKRLNYFKNFTNLIELVAYIAALVSLIPTCECKWGLQKEAAAVALFFGWINLIMYLQGLPFYGKYVIMLYTMFITLIKVMLLFLLFALAFGTTFHLIIDGDPFDSLPNIMMNMFIMMLGELNYVDTFMPWNKLFYPFVVNLVLVLFCLTMPIILMNMLVGLSVGDIDAIEQSALIDRYVLQVNLLNSLEETFPWWVLRKIQKRSFTYYPNKKQTIRKQIFDMLIGFGNVETDDDVGDDTAALATKVNDLRWKLDEQSHVIDDMKTTIKQMHEMMKQAEKERKQEQARAATKQSSKGLGVPVSLGKDGLNGLGNALSFGFGSKKSVAQIPEPKDDDEEEA